MNTTESQQLATLIKTVDKLEQVTAMQARRIKALELQNKKFHSALSAAQVRISTLQASMQNVTGQLNRR